MFTTDQAPGTRDELAQAFAAFNRLSGRLEQSYRALEVRVAELTHELARVRAERDAEALEARRVTERLEHLLATLPAGAVVIDAGGCVQAANAAAERILGADIAGLPWSTLTARALESACAANGDHVTRAGRRVTILSSAAAGDSVRIVLLADVTETRALEELASRNERLSAMGKMAASLAHQVRTPLSSALLYFSQCRDALDAPRAGELLASGIERLHEMNRLVQDMLVFARGSGPGERVRIADLFRDVRAAVASLLSGDAHLVIDGTDVLREIEGNRTALVAALTNLVSNALQAAPHGVVTLKAALRGERVELEVADDGPGIAPAIRSRVLEPFFSTRPAGTGLGLAVAKTVAEAHGGDLRLDSKVDHGTTVGLDLPARDALGARPAVAEALPA